MECKKSSPSDNPSEPGGNGLDKIVDCYADAYKNQPDALQGHKSFMTNLEGAFPGLDLSQARQLIPTADEGESK